MAFKSFHTTGTYLSNLWICSSLYGRPGKTNRKFTLARVSAMFSLLMVPLRSNVSLTSFCFVLLELLVDGGDGVQQHFDFLHTAETLGVRTRTRTNTQAVKSNRTLLPVVGVSSNLLSPAVGQQASRQEVLLDVLSRSLHRFQRTRDLQHVGQTSENLRQTLVKFYTDGTPTGPQAFL